MLKEDENTRFKFLLEMRGIYKSFPGVQALIDVNFDLRPGEVMALAGANGAGKSTLLKIVTGVYQRDAGEVMVRGAPVSYHTPAEGKKDGIAAIYQELTVIPNLTAAENIHIGEISQSTVIDYARFNRLTEDLLKKLDLDFDANTMVSSLTMANQQMVEIARAITEKSHILIMDEPSSALTEIEKEKLFDIVRRLKNQGMGIVFVTHRMKEIFEISDRVTVMKDGERVGCYDITDLNENKLVELMISRSIKSFFPKEAAAIGDTVLKVEHLQSGPRVKDVSFELKRGEILGLTGLLGAGRTETVRCIFGLDPMNSGNVWLFGREVNFQSPREAVMNGIALMSENRKEEGLVLNMSVAHNIILGSRLVRWIRNTLSETGVALEFMAKLNVKCTGPEQTVENLSGGNQQKVVIAKWLLRHSSILMLDEPTRGIDVAAKSEVHKIISDLAMDGTAIILISSEHDEIIGMCDRAVVLYEGISIGVIDRKEFSEEALMRMSHGYGSVSAS
jgi:ABC-type sugar transport system ATPase subunit